MNTYMEPGNNRQTQILDYLGRRLATLCSGHWDLNAIWLLHEDLNACQQQFGDQLPASVQKSIRTAAQILNQSIDASQFPDHGQADQLALLSQDLFDDDASQAKTEQGTVSAEAGGGDGIARYETPPKAYWRQWSEDATPAKAFNAEELPAAIAKPAKAATAPSADEHQDHAILSDETMHAPAKHLRIYHMTDYSALSIELDQLLEKQGFDIELINSDDELQELLQALPADLVLIDASYGDKYDAIHAIIANCRKTNAKRLIAVKLSATADADDATNTAGTHNDVVYSTAMDAGTLAGRIDKLLKFGKAEQYRVLIVEDDRSQAMFAEGILRNAEISTKVLLSAENLLETIDTFKPDLILMDLYLPNASGIELTELIRGSSHFQNTPIVFLSGEADEEKQMDALEAGGDDFLIKPIRPRRLIAIVQNRIKRHRALQNEATQLANPVVNHNGLLHRNDMLDLLKKDHESPDHALMYIYLNGYNMLKYKLGLSALESLLKQFSMHIVQACTPQPVARFGDSAFVMLYQGDCSEDALQAAAVKIRQRIMAQKFNIQGQMFELRIQIGICQFALGNTTDLLITIAEQTARQANTQATGVLVYRPQSSAEMLREERIIALLSASDKDLNKALSHLYQPIVAVAGSEEKQFQTLLRLHDDDGQMIPAAEFITIAEKSNLIVSLDRWSIAKAIATIAEQKLAGNEIKLFVNQSNVTLLDPGQLAWLKNLLKAHKIPDASLVIEINHEDALLNQKSIQDFGQALLYSGLQFCLSRYIPKNDESNLLESLPLSYVKLAHSFTANLSTQKVRDQIKMVVDRAHGHGLEVIGHSVEDAQTAATLWISGIDYIQGNLVKSANDHLDFSFAQSVL